MNSSAAPFKRMPLAISLRERIRSSFGVKLGRCARCIRLCAVVAAGAWTLVTILQHGSSASPVSRLAAYSLAVVSTSLVLAHAVAYLVRPPAPASGCRTCTEQTGIRRQPSRWARSLLRLGQPGRRSLRVADRRAGSARARRARSLVQVVAIAESLPPADQALRRVVEESPEFHLVSSWLADPNPVDTWQHDLRSHFVYAVRPELHGVGATVLFVATWECDRILTAVLVIPQPEGPPRMVALRQDVKTPATTPAS